MDMIIALDIGGTKTLLVAFDDVGQITHEERFTTEPDAQEFLKDLKNRLLSMEGQAKLLAVAVPGLIDPESGIIEYLPNLGWAHLPLKSELAQFMHCPIFIENDANIAGLGATHALETVPKLSLYITIGTGIGTGIITNGKIDAALSRAEAGHMVFETEKGLLQTWEQVASGRAITKEFGQLAADISSPQDWEKIAAHLSLGLRVLIPALQPEVVIIGGGVGAHFAHFAEPLQQQLRSQIPAFIAMPKLIPAIDAEKAVIHGCYFYALSQLSTPA